MAHPRTCNAGDPGNELVDVLARRAASGQALHSLDAWISDVARPGFATNVAWFWALFNKDFAPYWKEHHLVLPLPNSKPRQDLLVQPEVAREPGYATEVSQLCLKLLSCNVLSLKSTKAGLETGAGIVGPARQAALLQQLRTDGFHVFGFQETRIRRLLTAWDPNYILYKSAATEAGHFGVMAGFSKTITSSMKKWKASTVLS